jgi:adenylylsulfate kinase
MRILICGLPGSGKTTLAEELHRLTKFPHINADKVRKEYNDWDFSTEGRIRQAKRMKSIADKFSNCIADFVAPTHQLRMMFCPDILIWVNTIKQSSYEDTNKVFTEPLKYDFRVTSKDTKKWAMLIVKDLKNNV